MIWITADDVIAIHSRVIEKSGGLDGLRNKDILESAISAPLQSFGRFAALDQIAFIRERYI